MLDPYVVVFLTRDREGSKQKTSVQKKSLSPVWNQSLVFNELNYSDKLRVEIKANRQFQVNDFLCGFDFIVADVMAQSVQECQPSYRLVGEKVWSETCRGVAAPPAAQRVPQRRARFATQDTLAHSRRVLAVTGNWDPPGRL